ncbi:ClpXP protease specificity-enhancing factor [Seminibacterium arietis]|uniref:ClpXP protease specificity-enhancing factor n=1 Tax=Seminibacterium arietis TaxID=1173502 RepID=A0ABW3I7I1_9PAST
MEFRSSPKRPYILKAYYDWLVDNDFTPYLIVNADYEGVKVPLEYVKDGQIVLNLSLRATGNLQLTNDYIQFNARFNGEIQNLYIPMGAALAIYARENGDGVMFEPEIAYEKSNNIKKENPKLKLNKITNNNLNSSSSFDKERKSPNLRIITNKSN